MPTQTPDHPRQAPPAPAGTGTGDGSAGRTPLTHRRVLEAGLAYVDEHGLDGLTMRKLGASLGVEGTALYNHVHGKDGLLDGVVELLWAEMSEATDAGGTWQDMLRSLARTVRETVHRHPEAAPLVCRRAVMPTEALRLMADCMAPMEQAGFDRASAAQAMCAVWGHAYGYALMEQMACTCGVDRGGPESDAQRIRRVAQMLPPDVPDDLFEVGLAICGSDTGADFEAGIDLIVDGLSGCTPKNAV